MKPEVMRAAAFDLVYLVKCAVDGTVPDKERIEKMDLVDVRHIAEKHMLSAAAACALGSAGIKDADFEKDKAAAIWLNMQFDHHRAEITERLEECGIWYLPLKGAVVKDWYPDYSMRQMSDNDILFDPDRRSDVRKIMEELGFSVNSFDRGTHDVYQLPPQIDFEMHVTLFGAFSLPRVTEYYEKIKTRLVKDEGSGYGYHFRPEDYYIYSVAHEYKHYSNFGTGIRSLLDTYVFMKKFGASLDKDYIDRELEYLGLKEYAAKSFNLSEKLFSLQPLDAEETEAFDFYVTCGVFGTFTISVGQNIQRNGGGFKGKMKYVKNRLILPESDLKFLFPFYYKHKWLRPVLFVKRVYKVLFKSTRHFFRELKTIITHKSD